MKYDYPSVICEYCPYTEYGDLPCSVVTGDGTYVACEGCCCEQALDNYNDENENPITIEEAF